MKLPWSKGAGGLTTKSKVIGGASAAAVALFALFAAPGFGGHRDVPPPDELPIEGPFVALGDSYTAGEGLEPYLDGTQDVQLGGTRCHRSALAYAEVLSGTGESADLVFRACSSALMANILDVVQVHDDQPVGTVQVEGIARDASLVMITISGNDAEFSEVVKRCAQQLNCTGSSSWGDDPNGATLAEWAGTEILDIGSDLVPLFQRLRSEFRAARLLVVGYPRLFNEAVSTVGQPQCLLHRVAFSSRERRELRDLGDDLNDAIESAALAAGAEFVATADAFEGHETCGPSGQWISFLTSDAAGLRQQLAAALDGNIHPGNFHPSPDGQAMIARLVSCYLAEHPTNPHDGGAGGAVAHGLAGDAVFDCAAVG